MGGSQEKQPSRVSSLGAMETGTAGQLGIGPIVNGGGFEDVSSGQEVLKFESSVHEKSLAAFLLRGIRPPGSQIRLSREGVGVGADDRGAIASGNPHIGLPDRLNVDIGNYLPGAYGDRLGQPGVDGLRVISRMLVRVEVTGMLARRVVQIVVPGGHADDAVLAEIVGSSVALGHYLAIPKSRLGRPKWVRIQAFRIDLAEYQQLDPGALKRYPGGIRDPAGDDAILLQHNVHLGAGFIG
jgi:hypothetical protein